MLFFVCSLYRKNNRRFERRNKKSSDKINLADARRNLGCTEMKSRVARLPLVIIWGEYRFGLHRRLSILNLRYVSRRARACSRRVQFLTIVLASPGGRGSAAGGGEGEFYLLFCEKGKTVFRIRFPFLTLFPFPKTPQNPHKVIPYSLFQSPLIFKGQRSLVAERI